jgi:beta-galactosidase
LHYLAGWPDDATFDRLLREAAAEAGIETVDLPDGLRIRDAGDWRFVFNYAPEPLEFAGVEIPPAGVHWTRR